ncbi:hypothetical protein OK016_26835 [Vibrio chagasii]|nr:hypothetical protein [Vibrio chagasii]
MDLITEFAGIMNDEWSSIGLHPSMYGYMMDLATEPRWYQYTKTFTEDADLASGIMRSLIKGLQDGGEVNEDSDAVHQNTSLAAARKKTAVTHTMTLVKTKSTQKRTILITT